MAARGDPTKIAIWVVASRFDKNRLTLTASDNSERSHITGLLFDSDVKRMSIVFKHNANSDLVVFAKGAVERVIGTCQNCY
jgi:P-type Na+/K+ transporter